MSHIVVTAMGILWSLNVLVVLFSLHAAHSHRDLQGLSCVNDLVNNVSCTWNGSLTGPGVDCWIFGRKIIRVMKTDKRQSTIIMQSCKLKQHKDSPPGCSFVFENKLNCFEVMPNITMECYGTLVGSLANYRPCDHIKMHPPSAPNVSRTDDEILISWSQGSPLSDFYKNFDFQVQIRQNHQTWKEATTLSTQEQKLRIPASQLKGTCQVRVRVKPTDNEISHWSNWSPTTEYQDQESWLMQFVIFGLALIIVVMAILYWRCVSRGPLARKPVPNPSKYFHTLHSVHGGNLKKWLNPLSVSESFFTIQPCEQISPVEVCEKWDVVPSVSPSSSSTSALLHFRSYPSAGSDTSGVVDNSSSSISSGFSNMGYFMSSSSSSSARTHPSPAYFTYKEDFCNSPNSRNLHLSLCTSLTTSSTCESLKREEPQSPDSGFGIGKEDEEDKEDKRDVVEEEVSDDHQNIPLLILPLHLPSRMCPSSTPPPPLHPPSLTQISYDSQQVDATVAAASGSYAAWPVAGSMYRSSSMPVEPCKTGYLTLKELHTTFSNKSI